MVMPSDLPSILQAMFPSAVPLVDFQVGLVGGESVITRWNSAKLGPKPTEAEIIAAKPAKDAADDARRTKQRQAVQFLRSFDAATASAAQVRTAVGAMLVVLAAVIREEP